MDGLNYLADRQYLAGERSAEIEALRLAPEYYDEPEAPLAMGASSGQ